ncbi:putative leucine-rich repeat-containing protein DDB_G0290503 isoform X17 [Penaeus vannamei]|uniref:putative leucine-rich repeat-containing protein DDB_G0290503 isoform X17 n=1 Tax=Penaeus vannamei TaxID=6689 RepID=UPI00387F510A
MSNYKSDCRKFQPNIFNKSKCTNCFRQREEHSAEALESNRVRGGARGGKASKKSKSKEVMWSPRVRPRPRPPQHPHARDSTSSTASSDASLGSESTPTASRKVSKCGYLFVAPDWDFSIPLNRTKRWQRRWFVLYDDGELTYSVDDHPATIPQGVVDMNRVLEVSQAEDVTGNQFSLAITAPDRVTFIKGTCREESRWWMDVLSVFPRSQKQQGRHKRNATFPGIKTTTVLKQNMVSHSPSPSLAPTTFETPIGQRVRFLSCTTDPLGSRPPSAPALDMEEDVFPTKDSSTSSTHISTSSTSQAPTPTPLYHSTPLSSLPPPTRILRDEHKENTPPYAEDYTDNPPTSESPPTQDKLSHKFRTRRAIKREVRGLTQPRSKSEVTAMFPANLPSSVSPLRHGTTATTGHTTPSLYSSTGSIATSAYSTPEGSHSTLSPTHSAVVDAISSPEPRTVRRATITLTSSLSSLNSLTSSSSSSSSSASSSSSSAGSSVGVSSSLSSSLGGIGSSGGDGGGGVGTPSFRSLDSGVHVPTRPHARTAPDKPGEVTRQLLLSDLEESKREEKLKDIADSITRLRGSSSLSYLSSKSGLGDVKPTRERDAQDETDAAPEVSKTSSEETAEPSHPDHQVRGDPDGCGLEVSPPYTVNPDLQRVDLPAEDLLYIKKGWLMKQSLNHDWIKYWFVLRGTGLMFYRDPTAEDNGILDGIIDLSVAKSIEECDVARNYGFMILTWEEKKYVFSAVTSGIRGNWVQALRNAANLKESKDRPLTLGEQIEREIVAKRDRHNSQSSTFESMAAERDQGNDIHNDSISSANSRYVFSSDDEYRTASETSGGIRIQNKEDNFKCERARSRSNSRTRSSKRSRSSPPTSRRNTRDDFPSISKDEVLTSCYSESGSLHSISDLDAQHRPEKDSSATTLTGSGDALLVDLLETQVESLKAKLEQTQVKELLDRVEEQEHDLSEKASCANQLNELRKKLLREREEWQLKYKEVTSAQASRHDESVRTLTRSLQEAENRIQGLVTELECERASGANAPTRIPGAMEMAGLKRENQELTTQIEHLTNELARMRENLKSEKSEVYKWKDLVKELRSLLDGKNDEIERKRDEVKEAHARESSSTTSLALGIHPQGTTTSEPPIIVVDTLRDSLKETQKELDHTADRLHRGIEENEALCGRIRELERDLQDQARRASSSLSISSSRERFSSRKNLPRIESITDLTNFDLTQDPEDLDKEQLVDQFTELRLRFEKAVNEIKALKKEIRDIQNQHDDIELSNLKLRQDLKGSEGDFNSQLNLMTCRIQDLTNKLTASEKQVRLLKQKISRAESRDRRRTQSLKGRESFTLSKDMELKLSQLEAKIEQLLQNEEGSCSPEVEGEVKEGKGETKDTKVPKRSKSFDDSTKSSRLRRKSLDSPGSSEAMKAIVRLNALESKVSNITGEAIPTPSHTPKKEPRPRSPTHPVSPLRSPMRSPSVPRKTLRSPRATPEKTVKISRSDSETKSLRERLSALEKVLSTLQLQLGECVAWAGSVECICSCGAPGISSLLQRLNTAVRLTQLRHSPPDQAQTDRLRPLVLRLQDMLRDKLTDLNNRRDHLKATGKWTRDMQLKLFAERLAYETLVMTQVSQVVQAAQRPHMYEASVKLQELIEAHRKLSFLEKKLTNPDFDMETMAPLDFYTSLLAEKLVVQGEIALSVGPQPGGGRGTNIAPPAILGETCRDLQSRLLERERSLANLVTQYKEGKLHEVAVVMARETVTGSGPPHDDSVLLEEVRMREVWSMAQELVNQELVNIEAAHSLMRLSHLISPSETSPEAVTQVTAATLERCHTAADESLRQEMEEAVFTLSNKYEAVLAQYRAGDTAVINSVTATMDMVLSEFAAVVAQKAVIDGQLAVVQSEGDTTTSTCEHLNIVEENRDMIGSASDVVASEAHLLMFLGGCDSSLESLVQPALDQAEFTFLFNKMSAQGNSELTKLVLQAASQVRPEASPSSLKSQPADFGKEGDNELSPSLSQSSSPTKMPPSPKAKRKSETSRRSRRASDITGMADGCRQCEELRQEVAKLKKNLDSKRVKEREAECKQCIEYLNTLKALEKDHKIAMSALQSQHEEELSRLREQSRHEPPTRDSDDELTELKRRLCLLEEGYEAQISALKQQYEESIGSQPDMCEEKVRQRYQVEIEHLRGLCEKGLGAMENSHKRMLAELEEKHRRELAALQAEKEQALAEETQATLAALDAMRKAHEAEVQREIAKFKEEFIRKMQSGHDIGAIHKEHEAEMEDIRHEILSLSQKYSIKCLESAALEEKVDSLSKQLSDTSKQVLELEARNKQLKVHLTAQVSQLQAKDDCGRDLSTQLRLRESELALCNEEIARLTQQLEQAHSHEADLGELCRQLGHFLKAERQLRTDEVTALREKLEHIILTAANMQEQRSDTNTGNDTDTKSPLRRGASLSSARGKELMRSPSCPRLSGFSSFLAVGPSLGGTGPPAQTMADLPSPLAGMVASRKKVFETSKAFTENI